MVAVGWSFQCLPIRLLGNLSNEAQPALLLELARGLSQDAAKAQQAPAEVVVVSSSPGALWLEEQAAKLELTNFRRLEFQTRPHFRQSSDAQTYYSLF